MTDNVINFKRAKKRAGYAKKELTATENCKKFGQNKSEKRRDGFEKSEQRKHLDSHKLDE
ncbi:MAG: DUF4169 domain-containing protein [Robiginitomaculum sp.]|nr:MAG: DUF4169 domain-containing protein [Robiginitomaculum sp.]